MQTLSNAAQRGSRLQDWIEGRPKGNAHGGDLDVLLGPSANPETIGSLQLGGSSMVFVPDEKADEVRGQTIAEVVPYSGEFSMTGAEIGIGDDLLVQIESYATAEYLPIVCPTAISLVDRTDLRLLLEDAAIALDSGRFPDHLLNPLVTFVDLGPLLEYCPGVSTVIPRLYVQDDDVFSGPGIRRVEVIGAGLVPSASTPLADFLEDALVQVDRQSEHARRFIEATMAVRLASQRINADVLVSGFGWSASGEGRDGLPAPVGSPFVLKSGNDHFVVDVHRHRFGRVTGPVAEVVDSILRRRRPSRTSLSALGVSAWDPQQAEAVFVKLGLTFPSSVVLSNV
jgi:hypothetical protein